MSDVNPYQQPEADVVGNAAAPGDVQLSEPRKVTVGEALGWISDGMKLLSGHWGVVIGALVLIFVITTVLQFIPLIGPLAQPFLMTLLYGGLVKMFHRIDTTGQSDSPICSPVSPSGPVRCCCCRWRSWAFSWPSPWCLAAWPS